MRKQIYSPRKIEFAQQKEFKYFRRSKINPQQLLNRSFYSQGSLIKPNIKQKQKIKIKSFRDFLDESQVYDIAITKRKGKKVNKTSLLISFDNKIKPIHLKSLSNTPKQTALIQKQIICHRPVILKAQTFYRQNKNHRFLSEQTPQLNSNININNNINNSINININSKQNLQQLKKCVRPICYKQIKMRKIRRNDGNANFQCRPWTRRGQRQQSSEVSSKLLDPKP